MEEENKYKAVDNPLKTASLADRMAWKEPEYSVLPAAILYGVVYGLACLLVPLSAGTIVMPVGFATVMILVLDSVLQCCCEGMSDKSLDKTQFNMFVSVPTFCIAMALFNSPVIACLLVAMVVVADLLPRIFDPLNAYADRCKNEKAASEVTADANCVVGMGPSQ